jgi:hypothetical protein
MKLARLVFTADTRWPPVTTTFLVAALATIGRHIHAILGR